MATKDANGWTPNDYDALVAMAERQGAPASWFAATMLAESDLMPSAKNSLGYRGLIQFSPTYLKDFGLSDAQVANFTSWTPAQQMPYVERFLRPWRPVTGWVNRAQIQQAVYLPATIKLRGSTPESVIASKTDDSEALRRAYEANKAAFDPQNKGYIQVQDLENRLALVISHQPKRWTTALDGIHNAGGTSSSSDFSNVSSNTSTTVSTISNVNRQRLVLAATGLLIGFAGYYIYEQQQRMPRRRYA